MSTLFRLIPETTSVQTAIVESLTLPHYSAQAPFILIPDVEEMYSMLSAGVGWYGSSPPQSLDHWRGHSPIRSLEPDQSRYYHHSGGVDPYGDGWQSHLHSRRVPSIILDNGSALNVCLLATAITLGYAPSNFGPSTQTVRAYDKTRREVIGTLEIELLIAGVIPSPFHQKVKFIHNGQVITVQSIGDMFISSELVL
ncbi:hypothetical protein CK203_034444 [Vitis vinifera]|uniref:Uncharacterized protein n=1 Tax=Vitis vinifera TaxID=29760 RepID=A0A438HZA5_VITVI|nr:hypothetical protein CK203_034444 [Vitis vinifera]